MNKPTIAAAFTNIHTTQQTTLMNILQYQRIWSQGNCPVSFTSLHRRQKRSEIWKGCRTAATSTRKEKSQKFVIRTPQYWHRIIYQTSLLGRGDTGAPEYNWSDSCLCLSVTLFSDDDVLEWMISRCLVALVLYQNTLMIIQDFISKEESIAWAWHSLPFSRNQQPTKSTKEPSHVKPLHQLGLQLQETKVNFMWSQVCLPTYFKLRHNWRTLSLSLFHSLQHTLHKTHNTKRARSVRPVSLHLQQIQVPWNRSRAPT